AVAGNQPDTSAIAPGHDAKAVMLDFVNPAGAGRRGLGRRGQTRLDGPQSGAGTLTQRHARLIGTETEKVESVCRRPSSDANRSGRRHWRGRYEASAAGLSRNAATAIPVPVTTCAIALAAWRYSQRSAAPSRVSSLAASVSMLNLMLE